MSHRSINSQIDSLEARRLLAFATINPKLGHVDVVGTADDDTIVVALNADASEVDVTLNGETESFARNGVRLVTVDAGDGNDTVSIQSAIHSHVVGGDGNDSITGANGHDEFRGGAGDDTLDGGGNDDVLFGGDAGVADDGNDQLLGRGGKDTLISGGGTDSIDGGSGSDFADLSAFTQNLTLSLDDVANDGITGQSPASNLFSIETLMSGSGADSIVGSGDNDSITGGGGADTIFGVGGDDTLTGGASASLDGGSGDDVLFSNGGSLSGQGGNDRLTVDTIEITRGGGQPPLGVLDGGSGNDQLSVNGNGFTMLGQSGDDALSLTDQPDDPATASGDYRGGSGNDSLGVLVIELSHDTDPAFQITFDNIANDGVQGVAGTMNFHADFESIGGSEGSDKLDASAMHNGVSMTGDTGNDTLIGSAFADTLDGQGGNDSITAGDGNDSINSADGAVDTVDGGNGTDTATVDNGTDMVSNVENLS